jgi:ATP-dependent RNA helicase DDX41
MDNADVSKVQAALSKYKKIADARSYQSAAAEESNSEDDDVYVPLKKRKEDEMSGLDAVIRPRATKARDDVAAPEEEPAKMSLFDMAVERVRQQENGVELALQPVSQAVIEEELVANMQVSRSALVSAAELAKDIKYHEPMRTTWRPPPVLRFQSSDDAALMRLKYGIIVEGDDVPHPARTFKDLRLPMATIDLLAQQGIINPTPIQRQGLPVALSGRDMIGIAYTGSGKTLVFSLPAIFVSMDLETRIPIEGGEGPFALILVPSRELAKQTYDIIVAHAEALYRAHLPEVRCLLCTGGIDLRNQSSVLNRGAHIVVATPGRIQDLLKKKTFTLSQCRYLVLDEGDRMVDVGFEEDLRNIFSYFKAQRQTLLFSATMPKHIMNFARTALVKPVIVNVSRAGAANQNITQDVEFVHPEERMVAILRTLQKTAPPCLIFCDNKNDVEDVQEYLLLKGVEAVSNHGGKSQSEREEAVLAFKSGKADILVATDIAAKGLDFQNVQHVINFDCPEDIESYVHRIGRTGRRGQKGVATTFINNTADSQVLMDLKYLLKEAKQKIPDCLFDLVDPVREASTLFFIRFFLVFRLNVMLGCRSCGELRCLCVLWRPGPSHKQLQASDGEASQSNWSHVRKEKR